MDDEEAMLATLGAELTDAGYEVKTASEGETALTVLKENKFDVVLLDVRMPGIDGMEVLKFISQHSPTTKVIMLTALDDIKTALDAKRFGAHDYVSKPYILEDLLIKIQQAVNPTITL